MDWLNASPTWGQLILIYAVMWAVSSIIIGSIRAAIKGY